MTDFDTALNSFVTSCQKVTDEHHQKWYPSTHETSPTTISVDAGGQKFKRIVRSNTVQRSVHCFVSVTDGHNKKLGNWKAGDVFKADSWKAPARGVRGNIFDDQNGMTRMGAFGPEYNK